MHFIPGRAQIKTNQNIVTAIPKKFLVQGKPEQLGSPNFISEHSNKLDFLARA